MERQVNNICAVYSFRKKVYELFQKHVGSLLVIASGNSPIKRVQAAL